MPDDPIPLLVIHRRALPANLLRKILFQPRYVNPADDLRNRFARWITLILANIERHKELRPPDRRLRRQPHSAAAHHRRGLRVVHPPPADAIRIRPQRQT